MQILVTGAAGFIGSHLVERLIEDGHQVRGVDEFSTTYSVAKKRANCTVALASPRYHLVEGPLEELNLAALLDGINAVVHLAGEPGVRASWGQHFETYVRRNIMATQVLLEAVAQARIDRFVFASSSSVYGDLGAGEADERAPTQPLSPYGVTKLAGERLCLVYQNACAVPVVVLRYFTVYGPRQRPEMAVARFMKAALAGAACPIYGDGLQLRQLTYVSDIVDATVRALNCPIFPSGEVINVAAGKVVTLLDVATRVYDLVGQRIEIHFHSMQRGDVQIIQGPSHKARELLGWTPAVSLSLGLANQLESTAHL
jgi:nucleoside-diphosphate-sugar epimerase